MPTNFISFYRWAALDLLPLKRGQSPTCLSKFSIPAFSETRNCSNLATEKSYSLAISPRSTVPSTGSRVSLDATLCILLITMLACWLVQPSRVCYVCYANDDDFHFFSSLGSTQPMTDSFPIPRATQPLIGSGKMASL